MKEPQAYIDGEVEFYGAQISLTRDVLIPRQETEILVDHLLNRLDGKVLLDLCCGSGCIGIAVKKMRPDLEVILSDISREALEVAKENGKSVQDTATSFTITNTFTTDGEVAGTDEGLNKDETVAKTGLFDAGVFSTGNMLAVADLSPTTVVEGDTVTVTWTIKGTVV